MLLVLAAAGCGGGEPTAPTVRSNGEPFAVTGIVTDDHGAPVGAATVTMRYWLGGRISAPSVLTDASGRYTIGFTSNPWTIGTSGRGAARAEIFHLAYERYQRTVMATVTAGAAYYEVQIGLSRGLTTTQSVLLKTSLAPM